MSIFPTSICIPALQGCTVPGTSLAGIYQYWDAASPLDQPSLPGSETLSSSLSTLPVHMIHTVRLHGILYNICSVKTSVPDTRVTQSAYHVNILQKIPCPKVNHITVLDLRLWVYICHAITATTQIHAPKAILTLYSSKLVLGSNLFKPTHILR